MVETHLLHDRGMSNNDEETRRAAGGIGGLLLGAAVGGPVGAVVGGLGGLGLVDFALKGEKSVKRKAFYSFHYEPDNWRASQVRNIGVVEGSQVASDNDWETVKRGGDAAIQRWIDGQLTGRECTIVLIGQGTAGRKWINYEIVKSWNAGKGVLGIHIHNLKDRHGLQALKGANPFDSIAYGTNGPALSTVVKAYDCRFSDSKYVYDYIAGNLAGWIEEAISIRARN